MAYYSPEEMCNLLKIKSSTLRKHALELEEAGYIFQKNNRGHRYYSDTDLISLQKYIALKNSGDMSPKHSAIAVNQWKNGGDSVEIAVSATPIGTSQNVIAVEMMAQFIEKVEEQQQGLLEKMENSFDRQEEENRKIRKENNQLIQQNLELLDRMKDLEGVVRGISTIISDEKEESKGFFARLFNRN